MKEMLKNKAGKWSMKKVDVFKPSTLLLVAGVLIILQGFGVSIFDRMLFIVGSLKVTWGVLIVAVAALLVWLDGMK